MGFQHSEETRAKISAVRKGISLSEEHKANISASQMGNSYGKNQPSSQKIEVTDLQTGISTSYNSINEAARALDINPRCITSYFSRNQQKPYKRRYTFFKI